MEVFFLVSKKLRTDESHIDRLTKLEEVKCLSEEWIHIDIKKLGYRYLKTYGL